MVIGSTPIAGLYRLTISFLSIHLMKHQSLETFNQLLLERQLVLPGQHILIAVSGGQDSILLLNFAYHLQPFWQWHLATVYCDHQWSSHTQAHARDIYRLAFTMRLVHYTALPTRSGYTSESISRKWRYMSMQRIAKNHYYDVIALGHTASDRVETVLSHCLRGTGLNGLKSLQWQRSLIVKLPCSITLQNQYIGCVLPQQDFCWSWMHTMTWLNLSLHLIRPLLKWTRAEIRQMTKVRNLPLCVDRSNYALHWQRNRIRHQLLPYLRTYFNPQIDNALNNLVDLVEFESLYIQSITQSLFPSPQFSLDHVFYFFPLTYWQTLPIALQRRLLKKICNSDNSLTFTDLEKIRFNLQQFNPKIKSHFRLTRHTLLSIREAKLIFLTKVDTV